MAQRNFASATYEPTDDDLAELMREAFADVQQANVRALADLREQVRIRRALVLAKLRASAMSTAPGR